MKLYKILVYLEVSDEEQSELETMFGESPTQDEFVSEDEIEL